MSNTGDEMLLYLAKNINGFLSANNCTEAEAARGVYELIEDPERRDKGQRFLTQWQRSLLAADQESPKIHSLLMEICKAGDDLDEETLERMLEYIKALNENNT